MRRRLARYPRTTGFVVLVSFLAAWIGVTWLLWYPFLWVGCGLVLVYVLVDDIRRDRRDLGR